METDTDKQFMNLVNYNHNKQQERRTVTTEDKSPMNFGLAIGTLLIILAVVFAVIWGFGVDRFGILTAGAGGAGVVLLVVGALISGKNKH